MNLARDFVRSSAARVLVTTASMGVAFFMMPFLVGRLGDRWYGLYVILGGVGGYYYLLDLGLASATSRYLAEAIARRDDQRLNQLINTALVLFSALGGLIVVAAAVICYFVKFVISDPHDLAIIRTVVLIDGVALGLGFPVKAFGGIVFANMRYDLAEGCALARLVLEASAIVYFVSHGHGIVALAVINFFASQFYNVGFFLIARSLAPQMSLRPRMFSLTVCRELFRYSFWSLVNTVSDNIRFRIDGLVIGANRGAALVTHYAIGGRLAEYSLTLINRATNILIPVFTRYHALAEREETIAKLLLFTRLNAVLAFFGGGLVLLVGRPFIARWMGPAYLDAYPVLIALMIALMAEAIHAPCNNLLYGAARHRFLALASIVEAACNLALSLALVGPLGIIGVALGTTIPLIGNRLLVIPAYTCSFIGLPLRRFYLSLAPAALVTFSFLGIWWICTSGLLAPDYFRILLVAGLAAPLYLVLVVAVVLRPEERALLRRLAAGLRGLREGGSLDRES